MSSGKKGWFGESFKVIIRLKYESFWPLRLTSEDGSFAVVWKSNSRPPKQAGV